MTVDFNRADCFLISPHIFPTLSREQAVVWRQREVLSNISLVKKYRVRFIALLKYCQVIHIANQEADYLLTTFEGASESNGRPSTSNGYSFSLHSDFDTENAGATPFQERFDASLALVNTIRDDLCELRLIFNRQVSDSVIPTTLEEMMASQSPSDNNIVQGLEELAPVIARLAERFLTEEGTRVLFWNADWIYPNEFLICEEELNEKLGSVKTVIQGLVSGLFRIQAAVASSILDDSFRLNNPRIISSVIRMEGKIERMDNMLARIEPPMPSHSEAASATANQSFFQSICSWFSGMFEFFYNCLFGNTERSEG